MAMPSRVCLPELISFLWRGSLESGLMDWVEGSLWVVLDHSASSSFLQLNECCVEVLVTTFRDTILAECPQMIKNNETDSKYLKGDRDGERLNRETLNSGLWRKKGLVRRCQVWLDQVRLS